jgi:hypothetical protein
MLLDIEKLDCERELPSDVSWPLNRKLHIETMKLFAYRHNHFVSTERPSDPTSIEILHGYLNSLVATFFQAEQLKKYSPERDEIPKHASFWRYVICREDIPLRFVEQLSKGLNSNPIHRSLRHFKPSWMANGLHACGLNARLFRESIITTAGTNSLVLEHASLIRDKVYVCPLYEWFKPPTEGELAKVQAIEIDQEYVNRYLSMVREVFAESGVDGAERSLAYLKAWLAETSRYIIFYCDRLQNRLEFLPRRLWMNSVGIPWNSILAYSVRRSGGEVTVYDHALGANASIDSHTAFVELRNADHFITYSDEIKKMLETSYVQSGNLVRGPSIHSISDLGRPKRRIPLVRPPRRSADSPPQSVMFVQTMFSTDISYSNPLMPDVVAADWQLRLLRHLRRSGYRVFVKPHPSTRTNIPQACLDELKVEVLRENFEDVYDRADILLYDYTLTTTFGSGLRTDRHVVLIDFGYSKLPDSIWAKLDKRVARINGWFDEQNQAQVEWAELTRSINSGRAEADNSYVRDVLGG